MKIKRFICLLVFGLFLFSACHEISAGKRTGTITKFSKKGLIFSTYEGVAMLSSGTDSNSLSINAPWAFSVDIDAKHGEKLDVLLSEIQKAQESGKTVILNYVQEWIVSPFRANTRYFVTGIKYIN